MMGVTTLIYIACLGVTVHFMPNILYGASYKELGEICNAKTLNGIQEILKNLNLIEETARETAQRMINVSIVVSIVLIVIAIYSFSKTINSKQNENVNEDNNTNQSDNIEKKKSK